MDRERLTSGAKVNLDVAYNAIAAVDCRGVVDHRSIDQPILDPEVRLDFRVRGNSRCGKHPIRKFYYVSAR